jgi:hypothetical protein
MKVTWSQITPTKFEELCYLILEANEFTDIKWYGKSGGDRGRDLTANKEESLLPSIKTIAKWVVQCKRYVKKPPTIGDIESFLIKARAHRPDNVLIMITNTLTPDTKDWLDSVRRDYAFKIICWEELDLEREITFYRSQISERLPEIYSQADPVTIEELIKEQYVFICREVDQIQIVALDKPSKEKAREDVIDFIKFLRANEVDYDWQLTKKRRSRKRAS